MSEADENMPWWKAGSLTWADIKKAAVSLGILVVFGFLVGQCSIYLDGQRGNSPAERRAIRAASIIAETCISANNPRWQCVRECENARRPDTCIVEVWRIKPEWPEKRDVGDSQ